VDASQPVAPLLAARELARLLAWSLFSASLGLAALELALRSAGLPTGSTRSVRVAYDLEGETPGPYKAGARARIVWPPETAHDAGFNSLGCRGAEPRESDRGNILCVGDSMTYGLGVEDSETWPAQLDRLLAARGVGRGVVNLSSAHLVIEDELGYLKAALPVVRPEVVILLVPATGYIDPIDRLSRTPHEKSRRRERKRRVWPVSWYHASAIYEARTLSRLQRKRQALIASGRFPPSFEATSQQPPEFVRRLRPRFLARVTEFKDEVEASGARFVLAVFPGVSVRGGRAHYEEPPFPAPLLGTPSVVQVDLTKAFAEDGRVNELLLLPYDLHASPAGNGVIAAAVADALQRAGLLR